MVHGFASGPEEMRPVAERLASAGYRAVAITLPGHCTSPEDLETTPWSEWYAGVAAAAAALAPTSRRLFGAGLSTGGALLLRLAALEPDRLDGLATLSAPVRLGGFARLYPVVHGTRLDRWWRFWPKPLRDIRDRSAWSSYPCYPRLPIRSVGELLALLHDLRSRLGEVTAPIFVVQSRRDHTVSKKNARWILEGVSSSTRESLMLQRSFHVVTVDVEKDQVADAVTSFFNRLSSG